MSSTGWNQPRAKLWVLGTFYLFLWPEVLNALQPEPAAKVAVIGAGIGGSSAAYYLRQELGNSTTIDVFERDTVGGRTQVFFLEGMVIEMGASIIHGQNRHFRDLADALGLKRIEPGHGSKESLLSIYDGKSFVFSQSSWKVVTLFRLLRRYGLSLFWFQASPKALHAKFSRIYELQAQGRAFATPDELLSEIGLYNLTQHTMESEVQRVLGTGTAAVRFAKEFIAGVNHINYNQDNQMNAFAGMVSMLPTIDSRLFALEGGNFQLAVRLLSACSARLHQPSRVEVIERADNGSYLLRTQSGTIEGPFAAVVIATPLELSNLTFKGFEAPHIPPRKFQTTVTTIFQGKLQPSYFNTNSFPAGEYIMMAEGAGTPFSVVAPLTGCQNGTCLYKVFSSEALGTAETERLFGAGSRVIAQHVWKAYPRFHPPEQFAAFQLGEGLYYNNAWENAASAMEIAAIEGKNSALLVKQFLSSNGCLKDRKRLRDAAELR